MKPRDTKAGSDIAAMVSDVKKAALFIAGVFAILTPTFIFLPWVAEAVRWSRHAAKAFFGNA